MTQLRIKELLGRANLILENGWHFIPGFVMLKSSDLEAVLDRIDASIPEDIKEAESILRRREEIQIEAQQRAERIIIDAQKEAEKILSESELLNNAQREIDRMKEQVFNECQEFKERTIEEAKQIKIKAEDEAHRTKEGAENYAEQILNNIDSDLTQLHQIVKNGQLYLEKMKTSSNAPVNAVSNYEQQQYEENYASQNYPM